MFFVHFFTDVWNLFDNVAGRTGSSDNPFDRVSDNLHGRKFSIDESHEKKSAHRLVALLELARITAGLCTST